MISPRQLVLGSAIVFASLTVSALDALAGGDVIYGAGLARHQAAIPVPAPVPVPEVTSGYYVRLDAAYGRGDVSKYHSTDPRADEIRADSYVDNMTRFGIGAGYYFNKWLRGDITFDQRNDVKSRGTGNFNRTVLNGAAVPTQMRDTIAEGLWSSNSTGFVNAYIDVPVSTSFTPYFGVGVGYVRHQVQGLIYRSTTTCVDPVAVNCDNSPNTISRSGSSTGGGVDYALATALMAGFSYNISTNGKLDIGYRWLHLAGTTYVGRDTSTVHNVTIPDQNIHELRVGVRYDIN